MKNDDVKNEIERMTNNRREMDMGNGLEIDFDTADNITLINLMDQRKYLVKELNDYKEGKWLHPEDVINNTELIKALELLIPYYGGTND